MNVQGDTGAVQILAAGAACNNPPSPPFRRISPRITRRRRGSTGQRAFATDTRGTIYFNNTGAAVPAGMAGATPLQ